MRAITTATLFCAACGLAAGNLARAGLIGNLLVNPSGESGEMSPWTGSGWSVINTSGQLGPTDGSWWFRRGGGGGVNDLPPLQQVVDVSAYASEIDAGRATVIFGGDSFAVAGTGNPNSTNGRYDVAFLDAASNILETASSENLMQLSAYPDRRSDARLARRVPSGTTQIRFEAIARYGTSSSTIHGFDDLYLALGLGPAVRGPFTNPANGHRYYVVHADSWSGAEATAVSLGGHLVTINDADEQQWLVDTFLSGPEANMASWIGLTAAEGEWQWTSGDPVTYTNWQGGQPGSEQHAVMNWQHAHDPAAPFGTWRAVPIDGLTTGSPASTYPFGPYLGIAEIHEVPEPALIQLCLVALMLPLQMRRRHRR